jgi:hypothetical protein
MPKISVEQIRTRLAAMAERKAYFERKSNTPPERLARHEAWRHDYLSYPYLIGAPDDRVRTRFCDVFKNTTELGQDAKIGVCDFQRDDSLTQKFTHMLEEYGSRSGVPPAEVVAAARAPVVKYFEKGDPIAVKLFAGYPPPTTPFLVKYGRKEFLEPMLHEGRIRICPATYYNNLSHIESVHDDETRRTFFIPTFRERLDGKNSIEFRGHELIFGDDDIVVPVICRDYFLFSLCDQIYYRLPTDFDADAALIIRDPPLFTQRVISHFLAKQPGWDPLQGPVTYYDPYRDYKRISIPEMSKHFGYAYQREVRIAFRSKHAVQNGLLPEFLKIGSLSDFAELVSA